MTKVSAPEDREAKKKELAQTKKYDNPGQWLGNKHPITRLDKG